MNCYRRTTRPHLIKGILVCDNITTTSIEPAPTAPLVETEPAVTAPLVVNVVDAISPLTSNSCVGEVVPIPTFVVRYC